MSYVVRELERKRIDRAELDLLRVFYMLWCNMHVTLSSAEASRDDKAKAAQALVDQSKRLKDHYA